ncbi:MAG: hypothetical protein ACI4XL_06060 [Bacillus sp. (in: firmicutes)]
MFDPTAYENFKIIIEGSVYEMDFSEEILVIDRSETVDLAKLCRTFTIDYRLKEQDGTTGRITVRAPIRQLAAELLVHDEPQIGAFIEVHFLTKAGKLPTDQYIGRLTDSLRSIWGPDRDYYTAVQSYYLNGEKTGYKIKSTVSFKRLITEKQADDLYEIIRFGSRTLEELNKME